MRITSVRNERLQAVRRLVRDAAERRAERACVVEGVRVALEYVRGAGPVTLGIVSPRLLELHDGPRLRRELEDVFADRPGDLLETTDDVLASTGDARSPQGVLLVVPTPRQDGLPIGDGRAVLVAWEMQDPGNAGGLVRTAEGSGCAAAIIARDSGGPAADPFSPRALRASAGSAFRLPVHEWEGSPERLVAALRDSGFRIVASIPRGGIAPDQADLRGSCALLIGSEGHGLPERACAPPALCLTVPLAGAAESLNAGAAAAVIAFESARQRRG